MSIAGQTSGGLNSSNISTGISSVMRTFNAGMTSALSLDPMTVAVDDSNLAEMIKSSEAMAEIFRRTHAALGSSGISIDEVVDAIGADLVDGALDGIGASATNRRISALTVLTASQVMLEAMVNELQVDGEDVTAVLDDIIRRLSDGASPALTGSRPVTSQMIEQARRGIDAAIALEDSAELQALTSELDAVTAGMSPTQAKQTLTVESTLALDASIATVSTGTTSDFDTVLFALDSSSPPAPDNTAPVISGTPPLAVNEDEAYSFVPSASDADGDALDFSVLGLPSWASFNANTGALTGTPGAGDVGSHGAITISVSDGIASASLPSFWITVNEAPVTPPDPDPDPQPTNTPPVISGTPLTEVLQDNAYSFVPSASDTDDDALTFSVSGLPIWASFDPDTGALTGTPTAADLGSHGLITISVSDGTDTASLDSFSITVQAAAVGSATLSWVAPTENTDGSPLTDLAGYKVHWGQQSGSYSNSATVMNPGITTYVVENLTGGTHFFAVTALNEALTESTFSNEASKTIN